MVGRNAPFVERQLADEEIVQVGIPKSSDLSTSIKPTLVYTARATWRTPRLSVGDRLS